MKRLLLSLLLLVPVFASGQAKKDNTITIAIPDSTDAAYVAVGRLLVENGFTIATSNKDFGTISTATKPIDGSFGVKVNAYVKSGVVVLSGIYDGADITINGVSSTQEAPVTYATAKTNNMTKAWAELEKIARAYPSGKVSYGKR